MNFTISGTSVKWLGGDQGYRHLLLHYAHLAKAAALHGFPIDGFVIGSEMVALTRVRSDKNDFPFVKALCKLAADIKSLLGDDTCLTYAADWSEYFGYHPQDGSGDVYFNLDDLWSHPAIHAVGIDNYMPLSDWRDQDIASENRDGFRTQNDDEALVSQINSGEGFDFYYRSAADRKNRVRTPIKDSLGKPWVYRYKDIRSWWENLHFNRINEVELSKPTSWVPKSKPIWVTELGCPAVDKGSNQPNVFPDSKSSENALPYYSNNARDDLAQRSYLSAHIQYWSSDANPNGMVDLQHSFVWTWDARPYPAFPNNTAVWKDGENWRSGHWINGRLGNAPLRDLISSILTDHGFDEFDVARVEGSLQGFVQAEHSSARSLLETLLDLFLIDVRESEDKLVFSSKLKIAKAPIILNAIVDKNNEHFIQHIRHQESELVNEVQITHLASELSYQPSATYSRRLNRGSKRQGNLTLPGSADRETVTNIADQWLQNHWASSESIDFSLPIDDIALEVGDRIRFAHVGEFKPPAGTYSIVQIEDGLHRHITASRFVASSNLDQILDVPTAQTLNVSSGFKPNVILLDLPLSSGNNASAWARCAVFARPWKPVVLSSSSGEDGYQQRAKVTAPAIIGTLLKPLNAGPEGRLDHANQITIDLPFGALETIELSQLLSGGNIVAIRSQNAVWEIIQFQTAMEVAPNQWVLSKLLRAQSGTEDAMISGAQSGADIVFINHNVVNLGLISTELDIKLNWVISAQGKSNDHLKAMSFSGGARAHRPISPVHLRGRRTPEGIELSWIRRGRVSADNWSGAEIPEDEDKLQYLVKVYRDIEIVHQAVADRPTYIYKDLQQFSDFGYYPTSLMFSVQQIGGQIAQGVARKVTIPV